MVSQHCIAIKQGTHPVQVTARFDMPGIKKEAVHVSFQRTRLVVTWQNITVTEQEEEGRIVRERQEKTYSQSILLPEGTRVSEENLQIGLHG
jgi:HSP20 family molecular chaperone IbpA